MAQTEIYIKLEQNTEVTKPDVYLKDMADVVCSKLAAKPSKKSKMAEQKIQMAQATGSP